MNYEFARFTCSAILMPTFLVLATGCSSQQQPLAVVESKVAETNVSVDSNPELLPVIEPEAMAALNKMGGFLQTLKTFKVDFKVTKDELLVSGQKVMVEGTSELIVQKPNQLYFSTKVDENHRDLQFFYDGKTFTIYGNTNNLYASVPAPATIHELLDMVVERYDIDLPFRDLFSWGTDKADLEAIQSAIYIGPTKLNNVPCDHYAFRNADVDWQVWIQQGDKPLPLKLVITTKQEVEQPQYVSVMEWHLSPKINKKMFTFLPSKTAYKIDIVDNEAATENTQ